MWTEDAQLALGVAGRTLSRYKTVRKPNALLFIGLFRLSLARSLACLLQAVH